MKLLSLVWGKLEYPDDIVHLPILRLVISRRAAARSQ